MFKKLFLQKNHTFMDVVDILSKLLLILGINPYVIDIELKVGEIRLSIPKKHFYYTTFIRIFSFVVSLLNLYFYNYSFKNFNELMINILYVTYICTGVVAPLLSYTFQKKFLVIVKSLVKFNKMFSDCRKLDNNINFTIIIFVIRSGVLIILVYFGICIYIDVAGTTRYTIPNVMLYVSFYMFFFFINGALTTFIVLLCFLRLWFNKINKAVEAMSRSKKNIVNIPTVFKIHDSAIEFFDIVCHTFAPHVLFVSISTYVVMVLQTYSFIKMRVFGVNVTSIIRLIYYAYNVFQIFVILWFSHSTSDLVVFR